ncbi:MAG: hypothetical protein ACSHWY_09620 [Octadecabacter sp.]
MPAPEQRLMDLRRMLRPGGCSTSSI